MRYWQVKADVVYDFDTAVPRNVFTDVQEILNESMQSIGTHAQPCLLGEVQAGSSREIRMQWLVNRSYIEITAGMGGRWLSKLTDIGAASMSSCYQLHVPKRLVPLAAARPVDEMDALELYETLIEAGWKCEVYYAAPCPGPYEIGEPKIFWLHHQATRFRVL